MLGDGDDKNRLPGLPGLRKPYLRSVSWSERSPTATSVPRTLPQVSKPRSSLLPPLQPLSIAKKTVEDWPRAGSDDLGVWPQPPTPGAQKVLLKEADKSQQQQPPEREFLFKRDKLAFFNKECSRITDHVYLGSDTVAKNRDVLRQNGITHVLNCVGFVCPEYFKNDLVYKTLWLRDSPTEDITSILYDVFDYFEEVREQGGRVLVHCCQGVSRSTSLVIAYLMWREGQSFDDAFQHVKAARGVTNPNMGFACQLIQCQKRVHAVPASPNSVIRMYRMAPHSQYDPLHLVPKMLDYPSASGLDSRGAFIVHVPAAIYIWGGKKCHYVMLNMAMAAAFQVIRYESAKGPVVSIREDEEPPEFWDALAISRQELEEKDGNSNTDAVIQSVAEGREVGEYDNDYDIFQKAVAGGVVPPLSLPGAASTTFLPARDSGWGRLRQKFANGNMKVFLTSSKKNCEDAQQSDWGSNKTADAPQQVEHTISTDDSLLTPTSTSDCPDSLACSPSRSLDMAVDNSFQESVLSDPPTELSCSPCGSPDSFSCFLDSSPKYNSQLPSLIPDPPTEPSHFPCGSPDSFSCFLGSSPKDDSKSPSLSPSNSEYASSFTFSPSSSNWSDLSYLSSQQPSPSGLEFGDPLSAKDFCSVKKSCLYSKQSNPPLVDPFSANHPVILASSCLTCKGIPSIAERRGGNPPLLLLRSVDEPPRVRRNIVRSKSFSLDDDVMVDVYSKDFDLEFSEEDRDQKSQGWEYPLGDSWP